MSGRIVLLVAGTVMTALPALADEQQAIDGCIDKVREVGGPDGAGGGKLISSDFSQAGTLVMLRDAGGTVWRCLAANDGSVEDISILEAADDGGGAMAGAGDNRAVIRFPRGASGTTLSGAIIGRDDFDYILGAREGQVMEVSLKVDGTNGDGVIYFNILPPGSDNEAIFVGSMEEKPEASVRLPTSGDYTIRVYLMGNDKDTDKTVVYRLDVAISDGPPPDDALVPGTNYHATGEIECSFKDNPQVKKCSFGVVRQGGGDATVDVTFPDGFVRKLEFRNGNVTASDGAETKSERQGDNTVVQVNAAETFIIPIIVNEGG